MAVRDELGVGVEDRVGAETGGEDVRLGHRDLHAVGDQVEVLLHEHVDRLVDRHPAGRPFVLFGEVELAVGGDILPPGSAGRRTGSGPDVRKTGALGGERAAAGAWLPPGPLVR